MNRLLVMAFLALTGWLGLGAAGGNSIMLMAFLAAYVTGAVRLFLYAMAPYQHLRLGVGVGALPVTMWFWPIFALLWVVIWTLEGPRFSDRGGLDDE